MTTLQTLQDILIRDYLVPRDLATPEATLTTLGLDSLSIIELMFKIEDVFGLKITDDTPTNLVTVGDVVIYIDNMMSAQNAAQTRPAA
jgi:acyl carrier protein